MNYNTNTFVLFTFSLYIRPHCHVFCAWTRHISHLFSIISIHAKIDYPYILKFNKKQFTPIWVNGLQTSYMINKLQQENKGGIVRVPVFDLPLFLPSARQYSPIGRLSPVFPNRETISRSGDII